MDNKNATEKLEKIKSTIDTFKNKLLEKFDEYIQGIGLLPPLKEDKDKINLLILVDDVGSTKTSKEELKDKISKVVSKIAKQTHENINPQIFLNTEFVQDCQDDKGNIAKFMAQSAIIHDKGLLSAIKISEIHKQMVVQRFEKYIVSYILGGSVITDKARPDSDIDAFIVIDDTDVKKMSRIELRDKLRAIIVGMAAEAKQSVEIKRDFHVQVWILTDMWDNIKEANPVIFTVIRDGLPLYDRGMFMPWKQLLAMGKVKPSPEAVDIMMTTGDQMLQRIDVKLKEIGLDDFFWATITGSQAALMLYGLPPPVPNDTAKTLKEIFVKKEKIFKEKNIKIVEEILKVRKDIERGKITKVSGKLIDDLHAKSKEYLAELKILFEKIQIKKSKENIEIIIQDLNRIKKEVAKVEQIKHEEIIKELVTKNKLEKNNLDNLNEFEKITKDHKKSKVSKPEFNKAIKLGKNIIRNLLELLQKKELQKKELSRLRIKYDEKLAEIYNTSKGYILVKNVEDQENIYLLDKKTLKSKKITLKEVEELTKTQNLEKINLNTKLFEKLKKQLGPNLEVLI